MPVTLGAMFIQQNAVKYAIEGVELNIRPHGHRTEPFAINIKIVDLVSLMGKLFTNYGSSTYKM